MSAVLIDIDHFSDVNDGLGQEVGNELLIAVTRRLVEQFGDVAQIGRIGADVFGLIGPEHILTPASLNSVFTQPLPVRQNMRYRLTPPLVFAGWRIHPGRALASSSMFILR